MTCPNCGQQNANEADYCANCGHALSRAARRAAERGTSAAIFFGIVAGVALLAGYFALASVAISGNTRGCTNLPLLAVVVVPLIFMITTFVPGFAQQIYRRRFVRIVTAAVMLAVPAIPCDVLLLVGSGARHC